MPDTSVIVILNGQAFGGWTHMQITVDFDQVTSECTLRMSPQPGVPLPIRKGDEVIVLVAGEPAVTGYVRRVWGEHEMGSHDIQAVIRDRTDDLRQSTIGPKADVDPPCTLKEVCEKTLQVMGLNKIKVIDRVGAEPFKQGEKVSGEIDTRGHDFLDHWASRRHSVLRPDGKGNLVIDQNKGERLAGAFIHFGLPDDPLNNCTKSQFGVDDMHSANTHAVAGQKSPNDRKFWEGRDKGEPLGQAKAMSNRYGVAHDKSVRPELRKHSRGGRGHQGGSPRENAKWKANTQRAKSNEYVATVAGFTSQGGLRWWPGKVVPVYDSWWDINADLFLKTVSFTKDIKGGATSQLKFTLEDAFRPQAGRTKSAGRTSTGPLGEPGETHEGVSPEDMGLDQAEVDTDDGSTK